MEECKCIKCNNQTNIKVGNRYTVLKRLITSDRSYFGDVLTVICVDYPYAIASYKNKNKNEAYNIDIDLRDVVLKPLTDKYVNAYYCKCDSYFHCRNSCQFL